MIALLATLSQSGPKPAAGLRWPALDHSIPFDWRPLLVCVAAILLALCLLPWIKQRLRKSARAEDPTDFQGAHLASILTAFANAANNQDRRSLASEIACWLRAEFAMLLSIPAMTMRAEELEQHLRQLTDTVSRGRLVQKLEALRACEALSYRPVEHWISSDIDAVLTLRQTRLSTNASLTAASRDEP